MCYRIYFIDASAEDYEAAGDYEEEAEEYFDICANQGKLNYYEILSSKLNYYKIVPCKSI